MLNLGNSTRVYLAAGATDMRKSFEGLYALVKERMQLDPLNGHLYVFCNRWRNRLKVLYWDGSGLWVCAKRLEKGRFAWPPGQATTSSTMRLSVAEWTLLIEGIDLRQTHQRHWHRILATEK
jgi:transposase